MAKGIVVPHWALGARQGPSQHPRGYEKCELRRRPTIGRCEVAALGRPRDHSIPGIAIRMPASGRRSSASAGHGKALKWTAGKQESKRSDTVSHSAAVWPQPNKRNGSGSLYGRKRCGTVVAVPGCPVSRRMPGQASYVLILGVRADYVTTDEHGWKRTPVIVRVTGTSTRRGAARPTEAPRDWSVRSRGPPRSSQQARILARIPADARGCTQMERNASQAVDHALDFQAWPVEVQQQAERQAGRPHVAWCVHSNALMRIVRLPK